MYLECGDSASHQCFQGRVIGRTQDFTKKKRKTKVNLPEMADILVQIKQWLTPSKINIENFTSRLFYQITFGFCLGGFVILFGLVHVFTKTIYPSDLPVLFMIIDFYQLHLAVLFMIKDLHHILF